MVPRDAGPGKRQRIQQGAGRRKKVRLVIDKVAQEDGQVHVPAASQFSIDRLPGIVEFLLAIHLRIAHEGDTKPLRSSRLRGQEEHGGKNGREPARA
jgi:hypothetical protein